MSESSAVSAIPEVQNYRKTRRLCPDLWEANHHPTNSPVYLYFLKKSPDTNYSALVAPSVLKSPHFPNLLTVHEYPDQYVLVYEAFGDPLSALLPLSNRLHVLFQVFRGLRDLHARQAAYLNVNLGNIFVKNGVVILGSFSNLSFSTTRAHVTTSVDPRAQRAPFAPEVEFLDGSFVRSRHLAKNDVFAAGHLLLELMGFPVPADVPVTEFLETVLPKKLPNATTILDFLRCVMHADVKTRFSAEDALKHPVFAGVDKVPALVRALRRRSTRDVAFGDPRVVRQLSQLLRVSPDRLRAGNKEYLVAYWLLKEASDAAAAASPSHAADKENAATQKTIWRP